MTVILKIQARGFQTARSQWQLPRMIDFPNNLPWIELERAKLSTLLLELYIRRRLRER